jgi:hypothetical protein
MSTSAFVAGTWIVAYKATQVVPCMSSRSTSALYSVFA